MKQFFSLTLVSILFILMHLNAAPAEFFQNDQRPPSAFIQRPLTNSVPHAASFSLPNSTPRLHSRRLEAHQSHTTSALKKAAQVNISLRYITTSGDGYGWINSNMRTFDHFSGEDIISGEYISFITLAHIGAADGEIFAREIDVFGGLENGTVYTYGPLNSGIEGSGGHYPSVVTLERPFVSFNQSLYSDAGISSFYRKFHQQLRQQRQCLDYA